MPRLSPPVSKMSPQYFIRFGQNVPVSMHKLVPLVSWKKYIQPPKIHERDKKRTFYIFTKSCPSLTVQSMSGASNQSNRKGLCMLNSSTERSPIPESVNTTHRRQEHCGGRVSCHGPLIPQSMRSLMSR